VLCECPSKEEFFFFFLIQPAEERTTLYNEVLQEIQKKIIAHPQAIAWPYLRASFCLKRALASEKQML